MVIDYKKKKKSFCESGTTWMGHGGGEQSISYYTHQALSQVWIEGGGMLYGRKLTLLKASFCKKKSGLFLHAF